MHSARVNQEIYEFKLARMERLEKWKRGVDRDLNRYYELNPQHLAMKPGKKPKTA